MATKAEFYAWYAGCVLLGIPWWMLPDVSLGLYAFVYFWTWVIFLLATYRLGWSFHRLAGIALALALTFGIWLAIILYVVRFGEDSETWAILGSQYLSLHP